MIVLKGVRARDRRAQRHRAADGRSMLIAQDEEAFVDRHSPSRREVEDRLKFL
jgi:hypothetical protein